MINLEEQQIKQALQELDKRRIKHNFEYLKLMQPYELFDIRDNIKTLEKYGLEMEVGLDSKFIQVIIDLKIKGGVSKLTEDDRREQKEIKRDMDRYYESYEARRGGF